MCLYNEVRQIVQVLHKKTRPHQKLHADQGRRSYTAKSCKNPYTSL
jgi:hypothetical protein